MAGEDTSTSAATRTSIKCNPEKIHAGLIRVVWELNEVREGDGTMFLSGSHKAAFPASRSPERTRKRPVGHVFMRCGIRSNLHRSPVSYGHNMGQRRMESVEPIHLLQHRKFKNGGKKCPPPEVIAAMPPKRQTLFRGVWHGMREIPNVNKYYDDANIGRYV